VTRAAFAAVTALALVVSACSGGDGKAAKKTTPSSSAKRAAAPVAPLTGLPDPSGVAQTRPVLSVKVENTPDARPQSGLEHADIVWDEVVEGQITRLLAMFQSQSADVVGPIRSVRLTDPLIVWPVGGIFAYSGGAKYALNAIDAAPVTLVDESKAGAAMFRDRSRTAPHNLFGKPDALWAIGGKPVPPPPLFQYLSAGKAPTGTAATAVTIAFRGEYAVGYTWDAASGTWLRTTAGQPFVARSGVQIAPKNVVVLPVTYKGGLGEIGAEAELIGQGSVTVLSGGTVTRGTWVRPDKTRPMRLQTTDGKPIRLAPGSTWVELPDVSYAVNVVSPPPPPTPTG
jgi:Protein of unknown function (DUF3048) N-terminal domain/Protein of unknown function (DUF3048) C-terminal domain